jgi:Flp pilus assembly protein TadD
VHARKNEALSDRRFQRMGLAILGLSLLLYLFSMAPCAVPGWSAAYIVRHADLGPFPALTHPLWSWMVRAVRPLPMGGLAVRLNLLSAIFGALTVYLVYGLACRIPHNRRWYEVNHPQYARAACMISGVAAAMVFALLQPCRQMGTRAAPMMLDTFLFVAILRLLADFMEHPSARRLNGLALACGLGYAENGLIIPLVPVCLSAVIWKRHMLDRRAVLHALGLLMSGVLVWMLFALQVWRSTGAEWLGIHSYGAALREIWRWEWIGIRMAFPQLGWLLVTLVTIVPFILVVAVPHRSHRWNTQVGAMALDLLGAGLALALLFDVPLAPWNIMGLHQPLVFYLCVAAYAGYLAGYGYVLCRVPDRGHGVRFAGIRKVLHRLYLPVLACLFGVAVWMNYSRANGWKAFTLCELTGELLERIGSRPYFLSNGMLDENLVIAAHDRGQRLCVIDTSQVDHAPYRAYVAHILNDRRLAGLLDVGVSPAMTEWLRGMEQPGREVAVFAVPALWVAAGCTPVPDGLLYKGCEEVSVAQAVSRHAAFWQRFGSRMKRNAEEASSLQRWYRGILMHMSRIANDLGVWLEGEGQTTAARTAYEQALDFEPRNFSAAVNLLRIVQRTHPEQVKTVKARFLSETNEMRAVPPRLSAMVFGRFAGAMERHGEKSERMPRFDRDVLPGGNPGSNVALRHSLNGVLSVRDRVRNAETLREAGALFREGDVPAAREKLEGPAKEDPPNRRAQAALALIGVLEGDDQAGNFLRELQQTRELPPDVLIALARIAVAQHEPARARRYFMAALRMRPSDIAALRGLLFLAIRAGNEKNVETLTHRILHLKPRDPNANMLLGIQQLARGQYEKAESSFRTSLRGRESSAAWNNLAWTLHAMDRSEEALKAVEQALLLNPENTAAQDTRALIMNARIHGADQVEPHGPFSRHPDPEYREMPQPPRRP